MKACFDRAAALGIITADEASQLKKRFDQIAKETTDTAEARARMQAEVEAEAVHRERAALLTEIARSRILDQMEQFTNEDGQSDVLEAWLSMHENWGKIGSFVQDAEGRRETIVKASMHELKQLTTELGRGAILGDLSRTRGRKKLLMDNFVRELFGEGTGDASAKAMADAFAKVSEDLRIRFNAAGGAIGKLDRWGLPQGHNADALREIGQGAWVDYMMGDGVLDRERTVHPLSRQRLTEAELREALADIWLKITTDGWSNRDITAQPAGRGALYTQHADHRFLHFKSADAWMAYADRFGSRDAYATVMGHVGSMARDIAHMETFGPNPNAMRTYVSNWLRQRAATMGPVATVIAEMREKLAELEAELPMRHPDYDAAVRDLVAAERPIMDAMNGRPDMSEVARTQLQKYLRDMATWNNREFARQRERPGDAPEPRPSLPVILGREWSYLSTAVDRAAAARNRLYQIPYEMENPEIARKMAEVVDATPDPVTLASGVDPKRAMAVVNKELAKADSMWGMMRGEEPVDPIAAQRWQSARNFISGTSLGAAWISSLSDPASGQDARMRIGMKFGAAMGRAGVVRIMVQTLADMVSAGRRERYVDAMLGLDSAQNVLRRQSKEVSGWDHAFWSGWIADRTLTWGLLSPWTQAGKHLMGFDLMTFLGEQAGVSFDRLPPELQGALRSHGFDARSWDQARAAPLHNGLLRPNEIMALDRGVGERYLQMIHRETRSAVPEATLRSKAMVFGRGTEAGTISGELVRSMMQFKGFGLAVLQLKLIPVARDILSRNPNRMGIGLAFLVTSTALGAMAMALKDMKDGRDPRKWLKEETWLDWQHWGAAFLQAGGLGIYGDLLFSETNRFGQGLAGTVAGPLVGRASDMLSVTAEIKAALEGKKTSFGRWGVGQMRRNVPFVNHWATSKLWQAMVMDELQRKADPEAAAAFARMRQKRMRDYGQDYYWPPGSSLPQRAPDLSRILATR